MTKPIRIGTRDSELALWQAKTVQHQLEYLGYNTTLVEIKATGDLVLDKPLYELGITGIFTKNLDIALLNDEIDIAVHSLKDVPTVLPKGIIQAAVLKRGNSNDALVFKENEEFLAQKDAIIATGSVRRTAQWLDRYPSHTIVNLRGNVNTRLEKLKKSDWNASIFAAAGLERLNIKKPNTISLNWMIPAPAQGAIMIATLDENEIVKEASAKLNHEETEICTGIEREFLHVLEGGCTAPIGALAYVKEEEVHFKGVLLSRDGTKKLEVSKIEKLGKHANIAKYCAGKILEKGGKRIMLYDVQTQPSKTNVFSTKKLSESQEKLFHDDIAVESSDFIKTRFNRLNSKLIKNEIEHVIITSKNGVESLLSNFSAPELQFKNIYCVGRRTKKLIESTIGKVSHSEKNAEKLANYLSSKLKGQEVSYFCSDLRLDTLPTILNSSGIIVHEIEAYQTMYSPKVLDTTFDGVLFYSPSTVESFMKQNVADKMAFCIGESTAKEAKKYFKKIAVAKVPTVESVIELVNLHYV